MILATIDFVNHLIQDGPAQDPNPPEDIVHVHTCMYMGNWIYNLNVQDSTANAEEKPKDCEM